MKKGILLHEDSDDVGVATSDLLAGEEVQAVTLEGKPVTSIKLMNDIPLGHKVAMRELAEKKHIMEYGRAIGYASVDIAAGVHVHVHNIKSLRWAGKSQIIEH
ncbi:MAG: UxaA family hydrolase [Anaerolineaceae bacterium]|nr:UxaA family hydrolase [Anaerolineaceae bacterium]